MKFRDLKIGMHFSFLGLAEDHPAHNTPCVKRSPLTFTFQMDTNDYAQAVHKRVFYHTVIANNGRDVTLRMQGRADIGVVLV